MECNSGANMAAREMNKHGFSATLQPSFLSTASLKTEEDLKISKERIILNETLVTEKQDKCYT